MPRALILTLLTISTSASAAPGVLGMGISNDHACAVRSDGSVWCWGYNGGGALGDGTTRSATTPTQVRGIKDATAVVAGSDVSCARVESGNVWCWGARRPSAKRSDALATAAPTRVTHLDHTEILSIGPGSLVCGRLDSGEVRCAGADRSFVLPALKNATAIAAGNDRVSGVVGKTVILVDLTGDEQEVHPYDLGDGVEQIDAITSGFAGDSDGLCLVGRRKARAVVMCQRSSRTTPLAVRAVPATHANLAPRALSVARNFGQVIGADGRLYTFDPLATLSAKGDSIEPMAAFGDRSDYAAVWSGGLYRCQALVDGTLRCAGRFDGIDGTLTGTVAFASR